MGERLSQTARYWGLVIVMAAYFVPWVWLKDLYRSIGALFIRNAVPASGDRFILGATAVHGADKLAMTPDVDIRLAVIGIWISIAVMVMLWQTQNYVKNKRMLMDCARRFESLYAAQYGEAALKELWPEELVSRLKRELGIRREVKVLRIPGINTSVTLGAIKPVVFLQADCREGELEFVLRHEFTHIARGDLIVKFFMSLLCCLHWFNPIIYLISRLLDSTCEKACDERVIRDRSDGKRGIMPV